MSQLHRCIAWRLVTKTSLLSGTEIVFLRKMLHLNQRKFAEQLDVQPVQLCRWETGARNHGPAYDKVIRFVYLTSQDDEYTHEVWKVLNKLFAEIAHEVATPKVEIDPSECSPAREVENVLSQAA
jgi:DNA-binding transcriptional regulator YiaG